MAEGILDKYSGFVEKLENSNVKKPDLAIPCLAIIALSFLAILIYLSIPVDYNLTVLVTYNSSPVAKANVILYDSNLNSLDAKMTGSNGKAVFNGEFLTHVAVVYAVGPNNDNSSKKFDVFSTDSIKLDLFNFVQSTVALNSTSQPNNGFCSDGTPLNSCSLDNSGKVKGDGFYCNENGTLIQQDPNEDSSYSCFKCEDVNVGECQVDSKSQKTGKICKIVSSKATLTADDSCQPQITCTSKSETVNLGECFTSQQNGGYYCAASGNDIRQDKIKCKDYLPQTPDSYFLNPDGTAKGVQNQTIKTSSLSVEVYDNSSTPIDGIQLKYVLKNWLQDKKTGVVVNTINSNQSTIIFNNLTIGAYYYVDVQAGDCQASSSSKEMIINKDSLRNLIKVTLPVKFAGGSCYPIYPYSDRTFIAGGYLQEENFTMFSSGVTVSYDIYSEDYDPEIPDKDTKYTVQQKDGNPIKLFIRPDKNYFVVGYSKGYLPQVLESVAFNVTNLMNFTKVINTVNSWKTDAKNPANSGTLNIYVSDVNGKPVKHANIKISKLISSVGNLKLDFSKYFEKVIPSPSTQSSDSPDSSSDLILVTGDDGWLNVSSLPIDSNKNSFIVDADWNGIMTAEKPVQITQQNNIVKMQLIYQYTKITIQTIDLFDGKPIDAKVDILHPYSQGNPDYVSKWSCETTAAGQDCIIDENQKIFALTDFLVNVTPKDPVYKPALITQRISTQLNGLANVFTFQFFKPRDSPQVSLQYNDLSNDDNPSPLYSISSKSILQLRVKLIPPDVSKVKTTYTGVMIKLPTTPVDSGINVGFNTVVFVNPVSVQKNRWFGYASVANGYTGHPQVITKNDCGINGFDENSLTTFDKPNKVDEVSASKSGYTYAIVWMNTADIKNGVDLWFNIKTNVGNAVNQLKVDYSAFSVNNGFVLRNPVDEKFKKTSNKDAIYYSIDSADTNTNFCQAKTLSQIIPIQSYGSNYYCSQAYCFQVTSKKQQGSLSSELNSNSIILDNGNPVNIIGSLSFATDVSSTLFDKFTVNGDNKLFISGYGFNYPGFQSPVTSSNTFNPIKSIDVNTPNGFDKYSAQVESPGNIQSSFTIQKQSSGSSAGSTSLSLIFPKLMLDGVLINPAKFFLPLQIASNSTYSPQEGNLTLNPDEYGECSNKAFIYTDEKGQVNSSCNLLKFTLTSLFPADGLQIIFKNNNGLNVIGDFKFNAIDQPEIEAKDKDSLNCFAFVPLSSDLKAEEYSAVDQRNLDPRVLTFNLANCSASKFYGPFLSVFNTKIDPDTGQKNLLFNGNLTLDTSLGPLKFKVKVVVKDLVNINQQYNFFTREIKINGISQKIYDPSFVTYSTKIPNTNPKYSSLRVNYFASNNIISKELLPYTGTLEFKDSSGVSKALEINNMNSQQVITSYSNSPADLEFRIHGVQTDHGALEVTQNVFDFDKGLPQFTKNYVFSKSYVYDFTSFKNACNYLVTEFNKLNYNGLNTKINNLLERYPNTPWIVEPYVQQLAFWNQVKAFKDSDYCNKLPTKLQMNVSYPLNFSSLKQNYLDALLVYNNWGGITLNDVFYGDYLNAVNDELNFTCLDATPCVVPSLMNGVSELISKIGSFNLNTTGWKVDSYYSNYDDTGRETRNQLLTKEVFFRINRDGSTPFERFYEDISNDNEKIMKIIDLISKDYASQVCSLSKEARNLMDQSLFWRTKNMKYYCETDANGNPMPDKCKPTLRDWIGPSIVKKTASVTCNGGMSSQGTVSLQSNLTACFKLINENAIELCNADNSCPNDYVKDHPVFYYDSSCSLIKDATANNFGNPMQGWKTIPVNTLQRIISSPNAPTTNQWIYATAKTSCSQEELKTQLTSVTHTDSSLWSVQGNVDSVSSSPAEQMTFTISDDAKAQQIGGATQIITCKKADNQDSIQETCYYATPFSSEINGKRNLYPIDSSHLLCNPDCLLKDDSNGGKKGSAYFNYTVTQEGYTNTTPLAEVSLNGVSPDSLSNRRLSYYPFAYFSLNGSFGLNLPLNLLNLTQKINLSKSNVDKDFVTNFCNNNACANLSIYYTNKLIARSTSSNDQNLPLSESYLIQLTKGCDIDSMPSTFKSLQPDDNTRNTCNWQVLEKNANFSGLYSLKIGYSFDRDFQNPIPLSNLTVIKIDNFIQSTNPLSNLNYYFSCPKKLDFDNDKNNFLCGRVIAFSPSDDANIGCTIGLVQNDVLKIKKFTYVDKTKPYLATFSCQKQSRPASFQKFSYCIYNPEAFVINNGVVGWLDDSSLFVNSNPIYPMPDIPVSLFLLNPSYDLTLTAPHNFGVSEALVFPDQHANYLSYLTQYVNRTDLLGLKATDKAKVIDAYSKYGFPVKIRTIPVDDSKNVYDTRLVDISYFRPQCITSDAFTVVNGGLSSFKAPFADDCGTNNADITNGLFGIKILTSANNQFVLRNSNPNFGNELLIPNPSTYGKPGFYTGICIIPKDYSGGQNPCDLDKQSVQDALNYGGYQSFSSDSYSGIGSLGSSGYYDMAEVLTSYVNENFGKNRLSSIQYTPQLPVSFSLANFPEFQCANYSDESSDCFTKAFNYYSTLSTGSAIQRGWHNLTDNKYYVYTYGSIPSNSLNTKAPNGFVRINSNQVMAPTAYSRFLYNGGGWCPGGRLDTHYVGRVANFLDCPNFIKKYNDLSSNFYGAGNPAFAFSNNIDSSTAASDLHLDFIPDSNGLLGYACTFDGRPTTLLNRCNADADGFGSWGGTTYPPVGINTIGDRFNGGGSLNGYPQ